MWYLEKARSRLFVFLLGIQTNKCWHLGCVLPPAQSLCIRPAGELSLAEVLISQYSFM